ncbi:UDP-N-acetylmuramoyl-tripeptide--D-alanyl-D-alanine ligase [Phaeobacter gallaeciensis]|uniref:UDP-N-acetylmuramoyl-tripeptide--D-alanyl-D-alanine ligase n=1 Tax=Phaeobacter gallaeciensis TaxID=60890 RepID=A0AAD0EDR3_9RHOB|nr:UDP-N-acetylmuramoyl-tripeptide--D-alanyl-D-alanine ligase [Phaeobacter gallaeciensis]AHD10283.1 UDP-N-acetylmuramoyl-tripeptide--D-alanyl-D-alanine ligase [Phaeobacter gallaeciensis DSM 26640]ATE93547.1 UDP-N-acetylmuramoyl-tripeptide--D-alanyl-D- alanine ligase [Phaeobacter gallaeciensis]ATE96632.1 UDP-N-acetylmuramoyl-tripeptide--D-alanyl-D- alanine ligase [Phaeobacter gallaeciensis]ATF02211.1 UDP-N-acetylmuramoyl-tripeptide--D-alanyl-D- alanine ligase [Phaeobacter gallaeciensis]ATF06591
MSLWTAEEAAAATGGQAIGNWQVNGISIDTRSIAKGDLFVALKAARDGHDFVAQALEKGAGAALVSRRPEGIAEDAPLLLVDDVQTGLEALGRAGRARTDARVIAVTGSVGKTSTKEMLARMLSDQGRTHAAVASYNNHWGVPLTLARMPRDTEFAVIEIGMNHPGEISPLAKQACPHVAMVTTVAPVHLEAFDGIEGIAAEKAAIMEGLEPDGVAVLNADIDEALILQSVAQGKAGEVLWFGTGEGPIAPAWRLTATTLRGDETEADVTLPDGQTHRLHIQSLGAHFAMNALGALACLAALKLDLTKAVQSLSLWSPVTGRGARETVSLGEGKGEILLLDDSYNANPTSVAAALTVLAATPCEGRRIAYLGDMKELGPQEVELHAALAELPAMADLDAVHCIGPLMGTLHAALPEDKRGEHYATSAEVQPDLAGQIGAGDVVLAKGSLSMALAKIVDGIRELSHGDTTF